MDLDKFKQDYKYFISAGMCASVKYFMPQGILMIDAAKDLNQDVNTVIAEAACLISNFKLRKAVKLLENSIKEYSDDETLLGLYNFAKTLTMTVMDDSIKTGKAVDSKEHKVNKKNTLQDIENLFERSKDENIKDLLSNCREMVSDGIKS